MLVIFDKGKTYKNPAHFTCTRLIYCFYCPSTAQHNRREENRTFHGHKHGLLRTAFIAKVRQAAHNLHPRVIALKNQFFYHAAKQGEEDMYSVVSHHHRHDFSVSVILLSFSRAWHTPGLHTEDLCLMLGTQHVHTHIHATNVMHAYTEVLTHMHACMHTYIHTYSSFHGGWCWTEYWMPYFAQKGFDTYAVSLRYACMSM